MRSESGFLLEKRVYRFGRIPKKRKEQLQIRTVCSGAGEPFGNRNEKCRSLAAVRGSELWRKILFNGTIRTGKYKKPRTLKTAAKRCRMNNGK